jgi:hypothetical protein
MENSPVGVAVTGLPRNLLRVNYGIRRGGGQGILGAMRGDDLEYYRGIVREIRKDIAQELTEAPT